jgi:DNA (cytosine-5)-methyltransferase 1
MTCLDLFSGCGGFSLGLHRAGWQVKASIDFDPKAVEVYRANFPDTENILCRDLTKFPPVELKKLTGMTEVDMIVGGPPCQGFSQVRQRDGANHGGRLIEDPRRRLYEQYFQYVDEFQPKLFVMENVLGMRSAAGGRYFNAVHSTAREHGYRVIGTVIDAWKYGVPQKRRRQFIIGTRLDLPICFRPETIMSMVGERDFNLGHAICDLPRLAANSGSERTDYDLVRRQRHMENPLAAWYLNNVLEIGRSEVLTSHVARPHSDRDLRDFDKIPEGESSKEVLRRGVQLEFPYDRNSFYDRYTRQSRKDYCSTIVAHLSRDGLMFIHPTQRRSLTVREAARIQTFPDWFSFPVPRTHQYRVIGNAVPPLVAWAVANAAAQFVATVKTQLNQTRTSTLAYVPSNEKSAASALSQLLDLQSDNKLGSASKRDFLRGWGGAAYLYPGLNPDSVDELATETCEVQKGSRASFKHYDERLAGPVFVPSGWPIMLVEIGREARRRWKAKELSDDEYYCSAAAYAGYCASLAKETALGQSAKSIAG